jgi:hypothetical protein
MTSTSTYQVVFVLGSAAVDEATPRIVHLPTIDMFDAAFDPTACASVIKAAGLVPADMRSRVCVAVGADVSPSAALAGYVAACAFASRRLDVVTDGQVVSFAQLETTAAGFPDAGRPADVPEEIQVGAAHPVLPFHLADAPFSPQAVSLVRFARRCRLVAADVPLAALVQLVVLSALRSRGAADRTPVVVRGDEPVSDPDPDALPVGVELEAVRRAVMELRRELRADDRSALAEPLPLSSAAQTLVDAAAVSPAAVMLVLGSRCGPGGLWTCPRPDRHREGDAEASMRVEERKVRCFRCDAEKIDPVRLVADVKDCTFDEAAAWILAEVAPLAETLVAELIAAGLPLTTTAAEAAAAEAAGEVPVAA